MRLIRMSDITESDGVGQLLHPRGMQCRVSERAGKQQLKPWLEPCELPAVAVARLAEFSHNCLANGCHAQLQKKHMPRKRSLRGQQRSNLAFRSCPGRCHLCKFSCRRQRRTQQRLASRPQSKTSINKKNSNVIQPAQGPTPPAADQHSLDVNSKL